MPLDPQAQKLLDLARNAGLPPIFQVPISEARARMAKALTYTGEPEPLAQVEDVIIAGPGGPMTLRHYRSSSGKELPVVAFFTAAAGF